MVEDTEFDGLPEPELRACKSIAKGRWQLACVLFAVVALWGFVFPAISETEFQIERQRQLEAKGIDPMALFYTDHPSAQERLLKQ